MKLTVLGSGSPKASAERASSGYLIETGREKIMMECGPGSVQRLVEAGHDVTEIDKVFISHLHFDHWLDLMRLALCRWDHAGPDQPPLQVWGAPGIADIVAKAFGPDGLLRLDLTARTNHPQSLAIYHGRGGTGPRPWPRIEVVEIDGDTVVEGEGWRVGFAEVPHHQPYLISYAMRWEFAEGIFAYSSDITRDPALGPPEGLRRIAKDAKLLVQYVNVFGAKLMDRATATGTRGFHQMIGEMARDANVETMITTHQSPHLNIDGVRERITQEICNIFPGRLIWGRDLLEIGF
ncbi:MBL fold metallo-hydrolase [Albidovulum sediminicola]|uniref:MBL fold metallo-hydrolase n=1 Tax=Albidovulum sediminicola TaxID=2984331 RepID=A0ABT2Z6R2_9RHOB|nr:MBL fold metallo-hydrolase [Defluviimonas sp. WL0075]MCV2866707.1 MBL fold metallo-hydrolase [Defluviimonas sp. WL0075]